MNRITKRIRGLQSEFPGGFTISDDVSEQQVTKAAGALWLVSKLPAKVFGCLAYAIQPLSGIKNLPDGDIDPKV